MKLVKIFFVYSAFKIIVRFKNEMSWFVKYLMLYQTYIKWNFLCWNSVKENTHDFNRCSEWFMMNFCLSVFAVYLNIWIKRRSVLTVKSLFLSCYILTMTFLSFIQPVNKRMNICYDPGRNVGINHWTRPKSSWSLHLARK